jgi:hypothetical protein
MNRRRPPPLYSAALCVLYGAGITGLPLVHNAWHDHAHGHGHAHRHRARPPPAPVAALPQVHGHGPRALHHPAHAPAPLPQPRPAAPRPASDPRHGQGALEHFGLALGPAPHPPIVLAPALAPAARPVFDTTVFESSFHPTPAQARGPPSAPGLS